MNNWPRLPIVSALLCAALVACDHDDREDQNRIIVCPDDSEPACQDIPAEPINAGEA